MRNVIYKILKSHANNEVLPPLTEVEISEFEKSNRIRLPLDYVELLKHFDGGEILIPGPTIFGIKKSPFRKTIKEVNSKSNRKNFNVPNDYLIIGKTSYGDLICINLNVSNEIIQWDHETNEKFCSWKHLSEWLDDNLISFKKYEEGLK